MKRTPENAAAAKLLLSIRETTYALGISRSTVLRLVASGELPVVRIGDRPLFRPADLDALIERSSRSGSTR